MIEKNADRVQLKFTVEDTGIGIPEHRLNDIFESFEQAEEDTASKYGGTGLGLAIVKKLAQLKGGDLTVDSRIGKGSVFTFTNWYNIADKPRGENLEKIEKNLIPFTDVKILVAEDNLVNQFMLSKMLLDWKMKVDMVNNGAKAIEKLKENYYDIILMDTHMPEMNGIEAAKAIRTDFDEPKRSIPIISLSAASFDHEKLEALTAGMNELVTKPFKPDQLHEKIEKLINPAIG